MARKESPGADIFQILRNDHQKVSSIMEQLNDADEQQKQQIFDQLQEELNNHMSLEEQYFYPRVEDIEQLADVIQDCLADHDDIRQILEQMNEQDIDSEEWQTNCQALEDTKDDHVDLEEQEVFPQVVELMESSELKELGEQILAEKNRFAQAPAGRKGQRRAPRFEI